MSVPKHIAFIPDGNRRFGRSELKSAEAGHKAGVETIKTLVESAKEVGVKYTTFYIFSTENWNRSKEEVSYLMKLFVEYFTNYKEQLGTENVAVRFIGRRDRISRVLRTIIETVERETKHNNPEFTVTFALDYGGQDELLRTFKRMIKKVFTFRLNPFDMTIADVEQHLDTAVTPPVDLLIRTSGEQRLSNFLPWQLAYAELYFAGTHWPAFDKTEFTKALDWYASRERRLGGDGKK